MVYLTCDLKSKICAEDFWCAVKIRPRVLGNLHVHGSSSLGTEFGQTVSALNFLNCSVMEPTVLLWTLTAFIPMADLCLDTTWSWMSLESSLNFIVWIWVWLALWIVGTYTHRCVPVWIMSNLLNLGQLDSSHVLPTSQYNQSQQYAPELNLKRL